MRRVLSVKSAMRKALVLSFAVHAAIFGLARPLVLRAAAAAPPAAAPAADRWTGTTADLPFAGQAGAVYDVSVDSPAAEIPAPVAPPPAPAAPPPAPVAPPPAPVAPPPVPVAAAVPSAPAPEAVPAPVAPRPKRRPRSDAVAREGAASSSSSSAQAAGGFAPGPWGPEGPGSVRDFGQAFLRATSPASDSDPVWASVPLGDAGKLEVAVHIDGSGHIRSAEPRGAAPPRALVSLVARTIVLVQAGTFAARDATAIFEVRAVVRAAAPDGTDDQNSVDMQRGKSGFTQPGGHHVDVWVKVLRSDAR